MDYSKFKILVDLPAAKPALRFPEYAGALADIIRKSEPRFTIGVFAGWGSGKTTLMDEVKRQLRGSDTQIVCVDFNAWRYEKEKHLIVPLLDTIRETLAERQELGGDAVAETIGKAIRALLAGFSLQIGVPGALQLSFEANKALERADKTAPEAPARDWLGRLRKKTEAEDSAPAPSKDEQTARSFYHAAFRALRDAFNTIGKKARIVVFIDDLDRCLPEGSLEVLESIKLFFDLPGFVFVVGLDRTVVERCIDSRYGVPGAVKGDNEERATAAPARLIDGSDYIRKIFQVPFNLPSISRGQLEELLARIGEEAGLPADQIADLNDKVKRHIAYVADEQRGDVGINPRQVKRYINAYTLQMKMGENLNSDAVLALQTMTFRSDWQDVKDGLIAYGREFIDALRRCIEENDDEALSDVEPGLMMPESFRQYVTEAGPGHELLLVPNIEEYISTGRATESPVGAEFTEIVRALAQYKRVLRTLDKTEDAKQGAQEARKAIDALQRLEESMGKILSLPGAKPLTRHLETTHNTLATVSKGWTPEEWKQRHDQVMSSAEKLTTGLRHLRRQELV